MLLEAKNVTVYYGAVRAIECVSFQVEKGEIVAMIGPNGAGKSTALKAVSGLLHEYGGRITNGGVYFEGQDIRELRTDQLVRKRMALVPEGRRVFPTMSVLENLQMGSFTQTGNGDAGTNLEAVFKLLPTLKERLKQKAGTLSTGEQQMLALGRALVLKPTLLLADEPSLGLSPNYVNLIFDKLTEVNRMGTGILLVEQNAQMALEIARRAYVFGIGRIEVEGETGWLRARPEVKKVYLGG